MDETSQDQAAKKMLQSTLKDFQPEKMFVEQAGPDGITYCRTKQQEPYPIISLVSKDGKTIVTPKMVPDGNGSWKMHDPKTIAELIGETSSGKSKQTNRT